MSKRKPIMEGQPGALSPGDYQFVQFAGEPGLAWFREGDNGKHELFVARGRAGHSGWELFWRGTCWEFCSSESRA